MKKTYNIEIDCAGCAVKVEEAIRKIEGVQDISVNFITQRMSLKADDSIFEIVYKKAVKQACKIEPDFEVLS